MKTIEEKNRMIAEFLGFKMINDLQISTPKGGGAFLNELQYHTSWDWLMPVVEKIEDLGFVVEQKRIFCHIYKKPVKNNWFVNQIGDDKKDATYSAIVQFIEWYNKNK